MSLLNDASLVFIPSGYKEDKVYSVIPSNGAGDLDFVRGCDATRINPQALVENTPWNLLSYSEDFSNAAWGTFNCTVTTNQIIAPNGTNTADKIEISNVSLARLQQISNVSNLTIGLPCTFSIWIKSISGTGKVGFRSGQSGVSTLISFTNDWIRYEWTFNAAATNEEIQLCNNTLVGGADNSPAFYAWGAQLNIGSTAKPYFPTTDRLNVPRLTYSPTLIERQSTNLFTYSQDFDNASWEKNNVSILANSISAPDGTSTADTITSTGTTSFAYKVTTSYTSGQYTLSFYAKKGTSDYIWVYLNGYNAIFDLNNGTYVTSITNTPDSYTIVALSNGWYRVSITKTNPSADTVSGIGVATASGFNGVVGTNVYIWGAQLETGSLTSYIPTTSTAVTRVASYNSGCPSLLLEKQSTNLFLYSEQLDNVNWLKSGVSLNVNTSISPDGTQNADNVIYGSGGGAIEQLIYYSAGNLTHTVSCYVKCNSGTQDFQLKLTHAGVANYYSPTYTATTQWQRFTFTQAFGAGGIGFYAGVISANTTLNIWGLQLEANSSYATSYIPTTSATVTRLRDSCSKTGISSLIGQTEGTLFVDINNVLELDVPQLTIDDGTNNNRIVLYRSPTNGYISIFISVAGTNTNYSSTTSSSNGKIAIAYNNTGFVVYLNGTQILSFANSIPGNMSAIRLNGRATNDFYTVKNINQFLLFKRRLTNTELANLTTL